MRNIIKVLRAQNNLTQEELAQKIGISRQALSNIENNKVQPSGKVVIKIANIFGMPAEQIFFEEDVGEKSFGIQKWVIRYQRDAQSAGKKEGGERA